MLRKLIQSGFPIKTVASLLTGGLLACAFPLPPALEGLESPGGAWLALIPLMLVLRNARPREALGWAWLAGFVFWLVSLSWLLSLRHSWGNALLPAMGWVALSAYCALFAGWFGALFAMIPGGSSLSARLRPVLAAAVFWAGTEWLRGWLFTGFPWNPLGVSQYRNVALLQVAGWGGLPALSALIVLLNAAVAMTLCRIWHETRRPGGGRRVHVELMAGLVAVAVCWSLGLRTVRWMAAEPAGATLRVAAIQPAVPQVQKWSEAYEADIHDALRGQTELAMLSCPDLVVWPETATPGMLRIDPVTQRLVQSLAGSNSWLLVGSMDIHQPDGQDAGYRNASFLVAPDGSPVASYAKRHLVLFGEYLPFESRIPLLKRWAPLGFSCVPGPRRQTLIRIPALSVSADPVRLSVLICFEDVFPYLARRDVRRGARLLVNQTNDAWFDGSAASRQHLANAIPRTVENGVPMVRAANTGVTAFVDRMGRITECFADGREARGFSVASVTIPAADTRLPPYARLGDVVFGLPCVLLTLLATAFPVCKRFRTAAPGGRESGSPPS